MAKTTITLYMGDDYKDYTDKLKAIGKTLDKQGVEGMKSQLGTISMSAVVRYLVDQQMDIIEGE